MPQKNRGRSSGPISDIEVLRAVAVLLVINAHSSFLFPWNIPRLANAQQYLGFWSGVDLFFCISGFVIARSLAGHQRSSLTAKGFLEVALPFWVKRAWRLWPASWFWATFALAAAYFWGGIFGSTSMVLQEWASAVFQFADFYYINCLRRTGCESGSPLMTVYWSLALEEQFYFLFPFLLFALPRRWLIATLAALVILQLPLHRPIPSALWYVRTDALTLGILTAFWQQHSSYCRLDPKFMQNRVVAAIVMAGLVSGMMLVAAKQDSVALNVGLVAIFAWSIVFIASHDKDYVMRPSRAKMIMVWIGARSYALYLVHLPAFAVAGIACQAALPRSTEMSIGQALCFVTAGLTVLLVFTEFSYRLIELPLRQYGRHLAGSLARRMQAESPPVGAIGIPSPLPGDKRMDSMQTGQDSADKRIAFFLIAASFASISILAVVVIFAAQSHPVVAVRGDDIRVHTLVGLKHDHVVSSDGRAGFLLYGPYLPLPAGSYRATVYFSSRQPVGTIGKMDIAAEGGKVVFAEKAIDAATTIVEGEGYKVQLVFELSHPVTDIEVRVLLQTTALVELSHYEILSE